LKRFRLQQSFDLDDYQIAACTALADGKSVLVAAPTGAGKTVVGEFAVELAIASGGKAFYTTPIKALSNQKYHDLVRTFGAGRVGLLTGDTSINAEAQIVVMTTEVLRNMLYVGSELLRGLQYVVVDEVHYLADRFRGPVWEEVIIHLPEHVSLVALSATVSNAEEFGEWLSVVRGSQFKPIIVPRRDELQGAQAQKVQDDSVFGALIGATPSSSNAADRPSSVAIIVSEHRPVPLFPHVAVAGATPRALPRLLDLYTSSQSDTSSQGDTSEKVSPELVKLLTPLQNNRPSHRDSYRHSQRHSYQKERAGNYASDGSRNHTDKRRGGASMSAGRGERTRRNRVLRSGLIAALDADGLLPAIYFIFSRSGCDAAVDQLYHDGLRLTSSAEQAQISMLIEQRTANIGGDDLEALGYWHWRSCLERGIAAHHAGMLPVFKETVEELFKLGLIKVVFATETLALGINMPARTVVLEKLDKWNGVEHKEITPGEYTQLTGRAGRRGIDIEGHAVIVDHPGLDPSYLATLAAKRTYPLISAFKPTYNMSVNLVAQVGYDRAKSILETSFAQFQADKSAVGLARQIQAQEQALAGYQEAMSCDRGDFSQYLKLRQELSDFEKQGARAAKTVLRQDTEAAIAALKRGDIVAVPSGRRKGYAVVIEPAKYNHPTLILTEEKQARPLVATDAPRGLTVIGQISRFPKGFNHRRPDSRRDLAATLRASVQNAPPQPSAPKSSKTIEKGKIEDLRELLRNHPCAECPELAEHLRWGHRYQELTREHRKLESRLAGQTGTVARIFKRVCQVLVALHYLNPDFTVTEAGQWLRRIYLEQDLLLAECVRRDAWVELDAPGLAALVSALVYEGSRDTGEPIVPRHLNKPVEKALDRTQQIWLELEALAAQNRLDPPRPLALGLVEPIYQWTNGATLPTVLRHSDLAPGDFVRWCKQVVDVLNQLANVAPTKRMRNAARQATRRILRGVVAYSALDADVETEDDLAVPADAIAEDEADIAPDFEQDTTPKIEHMFDPDLYDLNIEPQAD